MRSRQYSENSDINRKRNSNKRSNKSISHLIFNKERLLNKYFELVKLKINEKKSNPPKKERRYSYIYRKYEKQITETIHDICNNPRRISSNVFNLKLNKVSSKSRKVVFNSKSNNKFIKDSEINNIESIDSMNNRKVSDDSFKQKKQKKRNFVENDNDIYSNRQYIIENINTINNIDIDEKIKDIDDEEKEINNELSSKKLNTYLLSNIDNDLYLKYKSSLNININFQTRNLNRINQVYDSLSDNEIESTQGQIIDFFINNNGTFGKIFDSLIFIIIILNILIIPIFLAGLYTSYTHLKVIFLISDFFFFFDFILNVLRSNKASISYIDLKYKNKSIKSFYIYVDFLSFIPFGSISLLNNQKSIFKVLSLVRLFKFLKVKYLNLYYFLTLFQIYKIQRILILSSVSKYDLQMKFLNFIVKFFIAIHISSCFYIFLVGYSYPNWYFSSCYKFSQDLEKYITSVYFHLVTILTIGYGDIISVSIYEIVYNSIFLFVGIALYSLTVSFLSKFEIDNNTKKEFDGNIMFLNHINNKFHIDNQIYTQIIKQLNHQYQRNKIGVKEILPLLPLNLKQDLIMDIYKNQYENFKFFRYLKTNKMLISQILLSLNPVILKKGDIILNEGQIVEETYFIQQGTFKLKIKYKDIEIFLITIHKNEHFGDAHMLLDKKSPLYIIVSSNTIELFILKKYDLIPILFNFPEIFDDLFYLSSKNLLSLNVFIEEKKKKVDQYLLDNIRQEENINKKMDVFNKNSNDFAPKVNKFSNNKSVKSLKSIKESIILNKSRSLISHIEDDDIDLIANPYKNDSLLLEKELKNNLTSSLINNNKLPHSPILIGKKVCNSPTQINSPTQKKKLVFSESIKHFPKSKKQNEILKQIDLTMEINHSKLSNPNNYFSYLINSTSVFKLKDKPINNSNFAFKPSRFEKTKTSNFNKIDNEIISMIRNLK